MRSASTWKNKEKKHLHRGITPACHCYGLLNRNPSRVSVSTSPGVSQMNKLAAVGYQHNPQWVTKIQAQACASKPRTAACLARKDPVPHVPHSDRCCCTQLRFKRAGVETRVIRAIPLEMLLSIYIYMRRGTIFKSSHTPLFLFSWVQVQQSSLTSHLHSAIRHRWILTQWKF